LGLPPKRVRASSARHHTVTRLAVVACFLACTEDVPVPVDARVQTRHAADAELHVSAELRRMSLVRELAPKRDVETVVLSRAALVAKLEAHVSRVVPRAEIDSEARFLKVLGVLPSDVDYERSVYDSLRESIGGMYEPLDKRMYVPDDLEPGVLALTVSHELVHALQDQYFDLGVLERYVPGASDTMLARSCLAEGDAMSATDEELDSSVLARGGYIEREIASPYVFGTAFVRALRRQGGWAEVDRAWTRGALTTEQVLHPDKWFAGERGIEVPVPTFASLGSATRVATDVRGELGLRLVLASAMPDGAAAQVAEAWGGDSLVIVRVDERYDALAWRVRFDDEPHARGAYPTLSQAFSPRACQVVRDARDIVVLVGPPADVCARWAKEIF
jgi:hypothetical protein